MSCKCHTKLHTMKATVQGAVKIITHDAKEVMVVPVVAIVEGVLNGKLVTVNEFAAIVEAWEGVAIPVRHPEVNGVKVSANLPSIIESSVIGHFHNVKLVGNTLQGEMYIDIEATKRKGFEPLLDRLAANEQIEVSTAYFADEETVSGTHEGITYNAKARNLRPDHLAILPDEVGACSVERGCGTFSRLLANAKRAVKSFLVGNADESLREKEHLLQTELRKGFTQDQPTPYVVDLFDDSVVYEMNGELHRAEYTIADGVVTLATPNAVRVVRKYEPITNTEAMTMAENTNAPAVVAPVALALNAQDAAAVQWARSQYDAKVDQLVAGITANASNKFTADQLKALPIATLETLAASLTPAAPVVDYSARGTAVAPVTNATNLPEALPKVGFAFNAK
jgi:hypothetical protein